MQRIEKRYEIKVYNSDGTDKDTIVSNTILSKISFSENINGGQGQLNLSLNVKYTDTNILNNDFIKVFVFDENFPNGKNLYTGVVESINRVYTADENFIEYTIRGLGSLLTRLFYNNGSSYVFSVNQDPGQTIKDIIAYFNTKYSGNWLNDSQVDNYGSSVNIGFDFTKISDAFNEIKDITGFYWYIDAIGNVYFKSNPVTTTHTFTAGTDLQSIEIEEDTFSLSNKTIIDWDGGQSNDEDVISQTNYGLRESYLNKSEIKNQASGDEAATNNVTENKDPKIKTPIIINNNFARENLKPGDTIKILNLEYKIENKQIRKIIYNRDTSTLEVDDFDSIATVF